MDRDWRPLVFEALNRGAYDEAGLLAAQWADCDPAAGEAQLILGDLALRKDDQRQAAVHWSGASLLPANAGLLVYRLADRAISDGYTQAASALLKAYIKGSGSVHAPIWLLLGEVMRMLGQPRLKLKAWFHAIRLAQLAGEWRNEASTPESILGLVSRAMSEVKAGRAELFSTTLMRFVDVYGASEMTRIQRTLTNYLGTSQDGPTDPRQKPKFLYMPGLHDRPYHDPRAQPWLHELVDAYDAIRHEALSALNSGDCHYKPFLEFKSQDDLPKYLGGAGGNRSWDAYFFYRHGRRFDGNHSNCPITSEVLGRVDKCEIAGQAPEICYSLLSPGTHILPHHGVTNTRLVLHLPLVVPEQCALNIIDAGVHVWQEGQPMMFDDTFKHEAWNRSESQRVILLMDCWNPEITQAERLALKELIEQISDFESTEELMMG